MSVYHEKARVMSFCPQNDKEEGIQRLFERLQHIDNRTVRRQNQKILDRLLTQMKQTISTVVCLNVAELFYNGAPGIPINLELTMEYYTQTWESLTDGSKSQEEVLSFLVNNTIEISYNVNIAVLKEAAERLRTIHNQFSLPHLNLTTTMLEARVFDLMSRRKESIALYKTAKTIAVSIGDDEHAIDCSKRKAILRAIGQEETDAAIQKYGKRLALSRGANSELAAHSTPGVNPINTIRGQFILKDDVDIDEVTAKMAKFGGTVAERELIECARCGEMECTIRFQKCGRCSITSYCGRSCQKAHWKKHKQVCCLTEQ